MGTGWRTTRLVVVATLIGGAGLTAGPAGEASATPTIECRTPTAARLNKLLDCAKDDAYPTSMPMIAVDPANAKHMVAGAHDFPDGPAGAQRTEVYTTFDGGGTWVSSDLPPEPVG